MPTNTAAEAELLMVRVLGSVDVITTGGIHPLGSRLERRLLAALALSANHQVSTDQLAEIVWRESPPPSRDKTLHSLISRLRVIVGPARITSEDHSYLLAVAPDQLDALVFEADILEAAEPGIDPWDGLGRCRQALALWRGPPFGELADEDPFRLEAIRLDELRLLAMELELEFDVSLGRAELVVGTLEALVKEYPFRERLWYLLASALSLTGRRVEALRACDQLRGVLADVGLEPAQEMAELEEAILLEAPLVRPRLRWEMGEARDPGPR